jgi:lysophospholipase L1-like esterase
MEAAAALLTCTAARLGFGCGPRMLNLFVQADFSRVFLTGGALLLTAQCTPAHTGAHALPSQASPAVAATERSGAAVHSAAAVAPSGGSHDSPAATAPQQSQAVNPEGQGEPADELNQASVAAPAPPVSSIPTTAVAPIEASSGPQTELPRGTTVLHIGDSFAGALGLELNRELQERGVRGVLKQQTATYIPTWAGRRELSGYLSKYSPDLILVTLGGNELDIVNPEQRANAIGRLVKRFGDTPCVWIGIPLWEGANPVLMQVIEQHAAPCKFLDSTRLVPDLERGKDRIHPSLPGRKRWAKAVVQWLAEQRQPGGQQPWSWRPAL